MGEFPSANLRDTEIFSSFRQGLIVPFYADENGNVAWFKLSLAICGFGDGVCNWRLERFLQRRRIPYAPDLATLEVVSKSLNDPMAWRMYRPFLNTFDFDVDPNDETIPWAELKDTKLQKIKAQFAVLEMLAELSNS
ncbi:hypothetical protein ED733_000542 [Metarhizium rileyi]|uniref:Uncharacterized protein n=1 Tax=Metarhizium rileyi (strain RCEF 4871) TaxID=1649241 RepID=A0A5C6G3A8_METRR|nr:hypothetical protein ED733_000542 [Metarhizium rileyi]